MSAKPRVSLVLGAGGARGLAHIGVIRAIEEAGYDIRYISGSSMGALIGGIYATGKLNVYEQWVCGLERMDIVQLLDFGWGKGGALFKGDRIMEVLKDLIGDRQIEELPIGYTAVATELNRRREVWFNRGSLFSAIRASIAIPLLFAPVHRGKQLLLDGGILNPIPIAPTLNDDTDLIIAVGLSGTDELAGPRLRRLERNGDEQAPAPDSAPEDAADPPRTSRGDAIRQSIVEFLESLWPGDGGAETAAPDYGMFDIALEAMDVMQTSIARLKLSAYAPDVLVEVPRSVARIHEFDRARELIDLGHRLMQERLQQL
ncbi:MAG: patatin-like phospholipase family protein [Pseudomonadales bacterium]